MRGYGTLSEADIRAIDKIVAELNAALERLGASAERALFVGDRIDDDCGGAIAAGVAPFLIDRSRQHTDAAANANFVHLHALTDLLTHLPNQRTNGYG